MFRPIRREKRTRFDMVSVFPPQTKSKLNLSPKLFIKFNSEKTNIIITQVLSKSFKILALVKVLISSIII